MFQVYFPMKIKRIKNFSLDKACELHKALSDHNRLRILSIMHFYGEICVSDLELLLDFTQTKTSRHITYLKNSGLVNFKRYEKWTYYTIREEYDDFIAHNIEAIKSDETIQADLQNYKVMYANSSLAIRLLHNRQNKYVLPEL